MKRSSVGLVLTHTAVALIGALVTALVLLVGGPLLLGWAAAALEPVAIGVGAGFVVATLVGLLLSWLAVRERRPAEPEPIEELPAAEDDEATEPGFDLAETNLAALVRRTAAGREPEFAAAGVQLHSLVTGKLLAQTDETRLVPVIEELLDNALRATRERTGGEVLLGVARTTEGGRPVARLTVTDNGVGVVPEDPARVFERLYRALNADADSDADTIDAGLSAAREVVTAHGGDLTANSPGLGRGATVTLTIPLSAAKEGA